jgi:hypothetical protein
LTSPFFFFSSSLHCWREVFVNARLLF